MHRYYGERLCKLGITREELVFLKRRQSRQCVLLGFPVEPMSGEGYVLSNAFV